MSEDDIELELQAPQNAVLVKVEVPVRGRDWFHRTAEAFVGLRCPRQHLGVDFGVREEEDLDAVEANMTLQGMVLPSFDPLYTMGIGFSMFLTFSLGTCAENEKNLAREVSQK